MNKRTIIDLFTGAGTWLPPFQKRGFYTIGFDLIHHPDHPGQLVLQDILTLHGSQFTGAVLILASPPCNEFAMFDKWPYLRKDRPQPSLSLVHAAFRIAHEAHVPLILENVRGAQPFIGQARSHFDSFYLWGDGVPALLPAHTHTRWKKAITSRNKTKRARIPPPLAEAIAAFYDL